MGMGMDLGETRHLGHSPLPFRCVGPVQGGVRGKSLGRLNCISKSEPPVLYKCGCRNLPHPNLHLPTQQNKGKKRRVKEKKRKEGKEEKIKEEIESKVKRKKGKKERKKERRNEGRNEGTKD